MLKTSPFTSWRFLYLLNFTVWYNYVSVAIPFAPCFLRSLISYSHLSVFKFHIHDQNDHMNFRPPKNHKPWPFFSLHIINPHNPLDQISSIIHVIIPSFFGCTHFWGIPTSPPPVASMAETWRASSGRTPWRRWRSASRAAWRSANGTPTSWPGTCCWRRMGDTTPGTALGADVDRLTWKGEKRRG